MRAGKFKPAQILITGHSLGGALAKICALDLSVNKVDGTATIPVKVVTMGEPRVGNEHFKNVFQEHVQDHMRLVMNWDVIPKVPVFHDRNVTIKISHPETRNTI